MGVETARDDRLGKSSSFRAALAAASGAGAAFTLAENDGG